MTNKVFAEMQFCNNGIGKFTGNGKKAAAIRRGW